MAFWKKKAEANPYEAPILLPVTDYLTFVRDFVDEMDSATRAHTAVAYRNLLPIVTAMYQVTKAKGEKFEIEDLTRMLARKVDEARDEINSRRLSWFLFSSYLGRLEKLARTHPEVIPLGAAIWTLIICEYPRLKLLLPHNVVRTNEEKVWFDLSESDQGLIQTGVNHHIPLAFARHESVQRFANDMEIIYSPSGPIGYIP